MTVRIPQADLLSRLLDASAARHQVLSQNISNVNTPGYRRQDVSFESALAKVLSATDGVADLQGAKIQVEETEGGHTRADGNNVDIDMEMGALAKNALLYQTYAELLSNKIQMMRSAISGR
jgi:flagellar basal-body rod protein FlgB